MSDHNDPTQSGSLPSVPLQPVVRWWKIGLGSRYHACTRDVFYWAKCGRGGHPHYGPFANPPEAEKCKECVARMEREATTLHRGEPTNTGENHGNQP